ncbi:MAG: hypothetical protein JO020_02170 [Chloroflexi bacterium]|nr:hypothetical protein [Chloroflexota bacterium]
MRPSIVVVSHFEASAVGHGGMHRSLQVESDARKLVGDDHVTVLSLDRWRAARQRSEAHNGHIGAGVGLSRSLRRYQVRARQLRDNPFKVFRIGRFATAIPFSTTAWVEEQFVAEYERLVAADDKPKVCVIEHAVFGAIVELNRRLGIPTISAFHNLEALDVTRFDWRSRRNVLTIMTDLGNELRLLGDCTARLSISKVEAGFIGGLGLDCQYYPYLPVGVLRERLMATRAKREAVRTRGGPIVLLGSAGHAVTADSMRWFLAQVLDQGLPPEVGIVAVGSDTDVLLEKPPARVELRGWVNQPDLDALLMQASAVVIPQQSGFGALTRLPELACAGVPVIAFGHPVLAINPTPGLHVVPHDWRCLSRAMQEAAAEVRTVSSDEYQDWERAQPRPLANALATALCHDDPVPT